MFKRVLIANRGEIALRVARTVREMGLESVAVYSDADAGSMHRKFADFAIRLPGRTSKETYLNIPLLMQAIKDSGADAVHPGYGFLSENQEFVQAVLDVGVTFIGPTPSSMAALGDKISGRNLMKSCGVPVVPGSEGALKDLADLEKHAKEIGFPMIIKASGGGGGRGMRVVRAMNELKDAYEVCVREAQSYFGNPQVFCERYIDAPHHVEFQVLFDQHGNGVHLFERDCTVQRRHQKLFEEAPSAFLSHEQRMRLGEVAVKAGLAAKYVGVGTVEFICESPEKCYFMEMNTRIQVEHPVTEMITGVDLIREQIRVAMGHKLRFKQSDLHIRGWSMEARINAEAPEKEFLPAAGRIKNFQAPAGPFVRFDSHVYAGYTIPAEYDSMIGKLIVWDENRESCIVRMQRALSELMVDGVPTTAKFHRRLMEHPDFRSLEIHTGWLEQKKNDLIRPDWELGEAASLPLDGAAVALSMVDQSQQDELNSSTDAWKSAAMLNGLRLS